MSPLRPSGHSTGAHLNIHTAMPPSHVPTNRTKRPYTRPCDLCAARRIRCDMSKRPDKRCTHCTELGLQCTNVRVKQKSGPKRIHEKTKEHIQRLIEEQASARASTLGPGPSSCEKIPVLLSHIKPYLEVYRVRYYGIWPVLDVDFCLKVLSSGVCFVRNQEYFVLKKESAVIYALCCSLSAAVARHTMFWTTEEFDSVAHLGLEKCPSPEEYVKEAERAIYDYELDYSPSQDTVLTYFFMHVYFSSLERENSKELVYLRHAISCAQLLRLFDTGRLVSRPAQEAHRIKKIYYLLLITERYVCFKTRLPVMLEPSWMPLPSMEDDENPEVLRGFIELAQVFSSTDTRFFNELCKRDKPLFLTYDTSEEVDTQWIRQVQDRLARAMVQVRNHSQKLNILLSRTWLQSIAWSMANDKLLLSPFGGAHDDCLGLRYPLHISTDFLIQAEGIPVDAFESNGPGVVFKLVELADALHSFIKISPDDNDVGFAFDQLDHVHGIILKHRSDIALPQSFEKVTDLLEVKRFGFRHLRMGDRASTSSVMSDKIVELADEADDDPERPSPGEVEQMSLTPFLREFELPYARQ